MTSLYVRLPSRPRAWLPRCQQAVRFRWLRPGYWHRWSYVHTRYNHGYFICDRCGRERR
jgi:hypothetical protein